MRLWLVGKCSRPLADAMRPLRHKTLIRNCCRNSELGSATSAQARGPLTLELAERIDRSLSCPAIRCLQVSVRAADSLPLDASPLRPWLLRAGCPQGQERGNPAKWRGGSRDLRCRSQWGRVFSRSYPRQGARRCDLLSRTLVTLVQTSARRAGS